MNDEVNARIDEFVARTAELTGKPVQERLPWNNEASADAIRHYAYGTDDDNPLWLDPEYAARTRHKTNLAPPAFLVSVLYPILHGAPMVAPLSSLIGGLAFEWFHLVRVGDRLRAESIQKEMFEKKSRSGKRLIFVISEVTYRNQNDEVVAKATGTMIRATQVGTELLFERPIKKYNEKELADIEAAYNAEKRRGSQTLYWEDVEAGQELPPILRGPLTIGDMVCWNAGLGPSYRAGRLGYLDLKKTPHNVAVNPATGFPVKYSMQHEDFHLASGRGMPGPFDNGVMRFAWGCPFITNWMGDDGFLRKMYLSVSRPLIYGDTIRYEGKVSEKSRDGNATVKVEITGTNQEGELASKGHAEVELPTRG